MILGSKVICEVPEGLILRPLLRLTYVDDIHQAALTKILLAW